MRNITSFDSFLIQIENHATRQGVGAMRMFKTIFVGIALLSAGSALAAQLPGGQQIGNWSARSYASDTTKKFSHCAANAKYKSGITVYFSISSDLQWVIAFSNPAWRLRAGDSYNIAFTVDAMSPLTAKATAFQGDAVKVTLLDSVELFSRFRRGQQLHVAAAGQIFSFALSDTSRLLPTLLACAQNNGRFEVQTARNPFETSTASIPQPKASTANEDYRAEATAFAANLLTLAGINEFKLLTPSESPEFKGDARWVAKKSTIGTVNVLPNATPARLKELPGLLIGMDAKTCKGTFMSGSIPDEGGALARVFTSCQLTLKEPLTVYYLAVPRKAGGAYVVSTFGVGTEQPAKDADADLRQAAFKLSAQ